MIFWFLSAKPSPFLHTINSIWEFQFYSSLIYKLKCSFCFERRQSSERTNPEFKIHGYPISQFNKRGQRWKKLRNKFTSKPFSFELFTSKLVWKKFLPTHYVMVKMTILLVIWFFNELYVKFLNNIHNFINRCILQISLKRNFSNYFKMMICVLPTWPNQCYEPFRIPFRFAYWDGLFWYNMMLTSQLKPFSP